MPPGEAIDEMLRARAEAFERYHDAQKDVLERADPRCPHGRSIFDIAHDCDDANA